MTDEPRRPSVLVVEDDAVLRRLVCEQLKTLGYLPLEAGAAEQALAIIAARCPVGEACDLDVLLADLQLPGEMDGLALARETRRRCPHLGVLLTTGAPPDQEPAALLSGARLLIKPYRRAVLAECLRELTTATGG